MCRRVRIASSVCAAAALVVSACGEDAGAPAIIGERVDFTPRARPDLSTSGLPVAESGNPVLVAVPGGQLEYDADRRDAITAFAGCVDLVLGCIEPGARRLDDCFRSSPRCATQTPWTEAGPCCAAACYERYATLRVAGTGEFEAFETTMFEEQDCVPGLAQRLVEGRR